MATEDDYREFIASRLQAGESLDDIRQWFDAQFLPLTDRCAFCGKPSTLLCDRVIGLQYAGTSPRGHDYTSIDLAPYTCDTPLCEGCAVNAGATHFSGDNGGFETTDYCPDCADKERVRRGVHAIPDVIKPEQADELRRARWMQLLYRKRVEQAS